jgi:hypothetical protein
VKLLFDENLSRHLVGRLAEQFPDSTHVTEMNLMTATDREVWEFARDNDYVIVSKGFRLKRSDLLPRSTAQGRLAESRQRVNDRDRSAPHRICRSDQGIRRQQG